MKVYSAPKLKLNDDVSFSKVTIEELEKSVSDIDEELLKESIKTKLMEQQSIEFSKTFHCSGNLNKTLILNKK